MDDAIDQNNFDYDLDNPNQPASQPLDQASDPVVANTNSQTTRPLDSADTIEESTNNTGLDASNYHSNLNSQVHRETADSTDSTSNSNPAAHSDSTTESTTTETTATTSTSTAASVRSIEGSAADQSSVPATSNNDLIESAPAAQPDHTTESAPKSKGKLIALIVAVVLLFGLAIAGTVFAIWRSQPEVVAFDVVSNILKAKNISMKGEIKTEFPESAAIKSITVTVSSASHLLPTSSEIKAKVAFAATNTPVSDLEVSIGTLIQKDGIFYINVLGLDDLHKQFEPLLEDLTNESMQQQIKDLVTKIEGKWYKVDPIALIDETAEITDKSLAKGAYTCTINTLADFANHSHEFLDFYQNNRFLNIEKYNGSKLKAKSGNTAYALKLKAEPLAGYLNHIKDTKYYQGYVDCLSRVDGMDQDLISTMKDFKSLDAEDLKRLIDFDEEMLVEVNDWTHQLVRTSNQAESYGFVATSYVEYTYSDQAAKLEIPNNATPVQELIKDIKNIVYDFLANSHHTYSVGNTRIINLGDYDEDLDEDTTFIDLGDFNQKL